MHSVHVAAMCEPQLTPVFIVVPPMEGGNGGGCVVSDGGGSDGGITVAKTP